MAPGLRRVGRFELIEEVGRGGMGVVYRARQTDLERDVAVKELPAFHATDETFVARFLRESRIAGSLQHPNIVTVYDYFEHDGVPYIAMEYVDRGSLRPLMRNLTLAQVAGVLEGMLAGLAHAETRGIVHRDMKPENLMVTSDGTIKIADFGIAKAFNQAAATSGFATRTGTTVGTPAYMAPEQAMAKDIGPWTDLLLRRRHRVRAAHRQGAVLRHRHAGRRADAAGQRPAAAAAVAEPVARSRPSAPGSSGCWRRSRTTATPARPTPGRRSRRSSSACSARAGAARRGSWSATPSSTPRSR